MTTIMIEITDEQAEALAQEADRLKLTVQALAVQRLLAPSAEKSAPTFDDAMEYVFQKNSELYRRSGCARRGISRIVRGTAANDVRR